MEEDSSYVFPVVLTPQEIDPLPGGTRVAVKCFESEAKPTSGLRCAFCDHFFTEFGTRSTSCVVQVQVSVDGLERKKWGGGELVWQCVRCRNLQRTITKEGQRLIVPRVPEATIEDVMRRVNDNVFSKAQGQKW